MAPAVKRRKTTNCERYLCTSCDTERTSSQFPDYNPTSKCEHLINICTACLKKHVQVQVEGTNFVKGSDENIFGIKCPQCKEVMLNSDVELAATKKVYQRFEEVERKHIGDTTPGWRWCLAPGCKAGQVHERKPDALITGPKKRKRGHGKKVTPDPTDEVDVCECVECGAKACVRCDRPFHVGESCADYQARIKDRLEEEDKTLAEIKKSTKPCPKCKKPTQKNGGCPNMLCAQCGCNYCWICLTDFYASNGYCKCHPAPPEVPQ